VFALRHDQDLETPIAVFARDRAGNEARASFVDKVFPKPFRQSRIELDDRFLNRVVPEILDHASDLNAPSDRLQAFLAINGELRRKNAERIKTLTANTSPSMLFTGPFVQLGNSKVEASFADHRTYVYQGKEVDRQVHLGFDLAATARVPVVAANGGTVLLAEWLGIYGNCVILDHGLGVASLYGHLSSIDVAPGARVERGQTLGRSGLTGLAGGDHLHFTLLVGGEPVNPVEWWDSHWMADRLERKLREAGAPAAAARP
jgi:murein DD-endopeptidase MepM/ murein hydrolase activator NlpD